MRRIVESLRLIPLLKVASGYCLGIALGYELSPSLSVMVLLAIIGIGVMVLGLRNHIYRWRWIFGVGVLLLSFSMGTIYATLKKAQFPSQTYSGRVEVTLQVTENPIERASGVRFQAAIVEAPDSLSYLIGRRCNTFIRGNVEAAYGEQWKCIATIATVDEPKNPGEFNFKEHYQRKGVYYTAFVMDSSMVNVGVGHTLFIYRWASKVQKYTLDTYRKYGFSGDELGILLALVVGDKQLLDSDLKSAYASVGAIHLLAISGMHVAIFYSGLLHLLFFLKRGKSAKIRNVIILVLLWFYAFTAGLSPSIVRATIMFTFIIVGQIVERKYNTYNLIAGSLVALLVYNPFYLYELGFQLSYLAVFSIILFFPLVRFPQTKISLINKILDLVSVSIAAQLLTFPLVVYYFNQFPLVFLASNILLVPLVSIIIYLGILLLAISSWLWGGVLLAVVLNVILLLINQIVFFLGSIPGAILQGIIVDRWQMLVIVMVVVLLYIFTIYRKPILLIVILCFSFISLGGSVVRKLQVPINRTVVYSIRGGSVILFGGSEGVVCLVDSVRTRDHYAFLQKTLLQWKYKNLNEVELVKIGEDYSSRSVKMSKGLVSFAGATYYIPSISSNRLKENEEKLAVDYLIVTSRCAANPQQLLRLVTPSSIVVDGSVSYIMRSRWSKIAASHGIAIHSISSHGAWILEK